MYRMCEYFIHAFVYATRSTLYTHCVGRRYSYTIYTVYVCISLYIFEKSGEKEQKKSRIYTLMCLYGLVMDKIITSPDNIPESLTHPFLPLTITRNFITNFST